MSIRLVQRCVPGRTVFRMPLPLISIHIAQKNLPICFVRHNSSNPADEKPWYLRDEAHEAVHAKTNSRLRSIEPLPETPEDSPEFLRQIVQYISEEQGLSEILFLDLRGIDPTPAWGDETIMVVATARSERHLHSASESILHWLKRTYKFKSFAQGLVRSEDLKIQRRRRMRKGKLSFSAADASIERSGWVCLDVNSCGIVLQLFTEQGRHEVELETLWNQRMDGFDGVEMRDRSTAVHYSAKSELQSPFRLQKRNFRAACSQCVGLADSISIIPYDPVDFPTTEISRMVFEQLVATGRYEESKRLQRTHPEAGTVLRVLQAHTHYLGILQDSGQNIRKTYNGRIAVVDSFRDCLPTRPEVEHLEEGMRFLGAGHLAFPDYFPSAWLNEQVDLFHEYEVNIPSDVYAYGLQTLANSRNPISDPEIVSIFGSSLLVNARISGMLEFIQHVTRDSRPIAKDDFLYCKLLDACILPDGSLEETAFDLEALMIALKVPMTPNIVKHWMTLLAKAKLWKPFWRWWLELSLAGVRRDLGLYQYLFETVASFGNRKTALIAISKVANEMFQEPSPIPITPQLKNGIEKCLLAADPHGADFKNVRTRVNM